MSSFKKIIYAALFLISSCGFSPLNSDINPRTLLEVVSVQEPNTQSEFIFYSRLTDRFGEFGDRYVLNYSISTSSEDSALNFDGTPHRIKIVGSVSYSLKDIKNGAVLISEKEEMHLSFSNSGSTAAVLNAERTTNEQLVVLLADKVIDRLVLFIVAKG
jgi:LPS-assembly lipoprotein